MSKKTKNNNKKMAFSKVLLIQESILIWVLTIAFLLLAFYCVHNQFFGELPWLAAMCGFPWTAYGVSQACYYKKSQKENTEGGITYATAMQAYNVANEYDEDAEADEDINT